MDETKPYIWIEPTRPPADSSREFGDTAAIHLVVPNVSRVDVPMTRTERNAVAFDYFLDAGINAFCIRYGRHGFDWRLRMRASRDRSLQSRSISRLDMRRGAWSRPRD